MKKYTANAYPARIARCTDGYVRLQFSTFCDLPFEQRSLIPDDDLRDELLAENLPVSTAGYCEWADASSPVLISVGWAWFTTEAFGTKYMAPGGVSSNVMLISRDLADLGMQRTQELLTAWLVGTSWQIDTSLAPRNFVARRALI
jgi:hypothetical protein